MREKFGFGQQQNKEKDKKLVIITNAAAQSANVGENGVFLMAFHMRRASVFVYCLDYSEKNGHFHPEA